MSGKRNLQASFWRDESPRGKSARLSLFPNVQFIYELALARLELEALGVKSQVADGLREFRAINGVDDRLLKKKVAYFQRVDGELTDYHFITQRNRTRSVNQYLTHWVYPYKGKFHPQMIRALINIMGLREGDTLLDPFIGSGTTAVEAVLLGINCVGIDISPLCVIQSKVKVRSVEALQAIEAHKAVFDEALREPSLNPDALAQRVDGIEDEIVRDFYLMGELIAWSDRERRRRDFLKAFKSNMELMLGSVKDFTEVVSKLGLTLGKASVKEGDARELPLQNESADGIITSPPYSIALDYVLQDAHAFKALGCNLELMREKFIGVRGKGQERVSLYNADMVESLREMYRVLKPGKFCTLIIGNATLGGYKIPTVEFTVKQCHSLGFSLVKNIPKIIFGLYSVMRSENILIFKKA